MNPNDLAAKEPRAAGSQSKNSTTDEHGFKQKETKGTKGRRRQDHTERQNHRKIAASELKLQGRRFAQAAKIFKDSSTDEHG
jgi:hypothetical protein